MNRHTYMISVWNYREMMRLMFLAYTIYFGCFLSNHKEDYNQQYIGLQYNQQIWVCLKWCIASNGNFNRENHDKPMDFGSPS